MKRLLIMFIAVCVIAAGAMASSAAAAGGTYFVGASPGVAKVSFVVRDGNVERALLTARGLQCTDGARGLFKAYDDIALNGNRFARKHRREGRFQAAFKGHVHRSSASGRMELAEPNCGTGRISWEAKSVSRERWLAANSRLPGPGR